MYSNGLTFNKINFHVRNIQIVVCYSIDILAVQVVTASKTAEVSIESKHFPWTFNLPTERLYILSTAKYWAIASATMSSFARVTYGEFQWIERPVILQPEEKSFRVANVTIRVPALWQVATVYRVVCVVENCYSGALTVTLLMKRRGRTSVSADLVQQLEVAWLPDPRDQLISIRFFKKLRHCLTCYVSWNKFILQSIQLCSNHHNRN